MENGNSPIDESKRAIDNQQENTPVPLEISKMSLEENAIDTQHIEKVANFVRRHRAESISISSWKNNASWISTGSHGPLEETKLKSPFVSSSPIQMSPITDAITPISPEEFHYPMEYSPATFGKMLFNGQVPSIPVEKLASILGQNDPYHSAALIAFMDCFDFSNMGVDEAFRHVCQTIDVTGETQVMDRLLFQIARRLWDCNQSIQESFKSIDITYGVLFSLVLLNTDLNIANMSKESQKMNQQEFLKNTLELVYSMILNDPLLKAEYKPSSEKMKLLKKDLQVNLKLYYKSIKNNNLLPKRAANFSNIETTNLENNEPSLKRNGSSWSLSSGISTGSIFSISSSASVHGQRKNFLLPRPMFGSSRTIKNHPIKLPVEEQNILFQGVCIRKHVFEKVGVKAKNRKWIKLWCSLIQSKDSLLLTMDVVQNNISTNFSSDLNSMKLKNMQQEVFVVLHSVATALRTMSYSSKRPFIFSLLLANGCTYLFNVHSPKLVEEWVRIINYWAARKSKEPLRDVFSSAEYGWTQIEWMKKKSQLDKVNFDPKSIALQPGKIKLNDWEPPNTNSERLILSNLNDEEQLLNLQRQILYLEIELSTHSSCKEIMEIVYLDTSTKTKALENWLRRQHYLEEELLKYQTYASSLKKSSTPTVSGQEIGTSYALYNLTELNEKPALENIREFDE